MARKNKTKEERFDGQLGKSEFDIDSLEINVLGFRNCRTVVSESSLDGLSADIKNGKLLDDPIVWATSDKDGERTVVLAGHRRIEAIKRERERLTKENGTTGGWFDTIRCSIFEGSLDDAISLNIRENLQREDLNPADEFEAIAKMYERIKCSDNPEAAQSQVASMLNVSQPTVSNAIRTYTCLCAEAFEALRHGNINRSQARKLAGMLKDDRTPDSEAQVAWLEKYLTKDDKSFEKKKKRTKTYRSKSEVELLRQSLAKEEDNDVDRDHRNSLNQFIRWYFCEIETDGMLYRLDETELVETIEEEAPKPVKRRKRIKVGE